MALPVGHAVTAQFHDRGNRIHDLVLRVKDLNQAYPNRIVIFRGVNSEIFNDVIYPRAFRLVGIPEVYVVPEEQSRIGLRVSPEAARTFFIDPALEQQVLRENRAVVYDLNSGVRDVTSEYKSPTSIAPSNGMSSHVEIGDRMMWTARTHLVPERRRLPLDAQAGLVTCCAGQTGPMKIVREGILPGGDPYARPTADSRNRRRCGTNARIHQPAGL